MTDLELDLKLSKVFKRQRELVGNSNFHIDGWDVVKFHALLKAFALEFDIVSPVVKGRKRLIRREDGEDEAEKNHHRD